MVIAGLSNTYADYIVTPEEYSVQRYEGGSTIYGPYTLPAYIQEFNKLAVALATVGVYINNYMFGPYLVVYKILALYFKYFGPERLYSILVSICFDPFAVI